MIIVQFKYTASRVSKFYLSPTSCSNASLVVSLLTTYQFYAGIFASTNSLYLYKDINENGKLLYKAKMNEGCVNLLMGELIDESPKFSLEEMIECFKFPFITDVVGTRCLDWHDIALMIRHLHTLYADTDKRSSYVIIARDKTLTVAIKDTEVVIFDCQECDPYGISLIHGNMSNIAAIMETIDGLFRDKYHFSLSCVNIKRLRVNCAAKTTTCRISI